MPSGPVPSSGKYPVFSCAGGKFEYTGLILRYEMLPTMKLICFQNSHGAPVEQLVSADHVAVTVTAKGKLTGLK
jgi:hypothetical protein